MTILFFILALIGVIILGFVVDRLIFRGADGFSADDADGFPEEFEDASQGEKSSVIQRLRREAASKEAQQVFDRFLSLGLINPKALTRKLQQAGLRSPKHRATFALAKAILPVVFLAVFCYFNFFTQLDLLLFRMPVSGALFWVFILLVPILGFFAPDIYIQNRVTKRIGEFQVRYSEAIDLMLISVEAGSSIEAALESVVEEMVQSAPVISEEFGLLLAELSYLPNRRDAFHNLYLRVPLDNVRPLISTLVQADRYGTNLGPSLRLIAKETRQNKLLEIERKAASLPAKLTVPLALFIFPVIFVVILGPAIIQVMNSGFF